MLVGYVIREVVRYVFLDSVSCSRAFIVEFHKKILGLDDITHCRHNLGSLISLGVQIEVCGKCLSYVGFQEIVAVSFDPSQ